MGKIPGPAGGESSNELVRGQRCRRPLRRTRAASPSTAVGDRWCSPERAATLALAGSFADCGARRTAPRPPDARVRVRSAAGKMSADVRMLGARWTVVPCRVLHCAGQPAILLAARPAARRPVISGCPSTLSIAGASACLAQLISSSVSVAAINSPITTAPRTSSAGSNRPAVCASVRHRDYQCVSVQAIVTMPSLLTRGYPFKSGASRSSDVSDHRRLSRSKGFVK
jgi:hypothetical protein